MKAFTLNKYLLYKRLGPLLRHDVQVWDGPVVGALVRPLLSNHLPQGYPF